jgi:hypothetical protein
LGRVIKCFLDGGGRFPHEELAKRLTSVMQCTLVWWTIPPSRCL